MYKNRLIYQAFSGNMPNREPGESSNCPMRKLLAFCIGLYYDILDESMRIERHIVKTSDFYYDLPQELIAQTPLERRDGSRLLTMDRTTGQISHEHFYNICSHLNPGDTLVLNDSRVLPARLLGHRVPTGGAVELLLLKDCGDGLWECLARPGRKLKPGSEVSFGNDELTAVIEEDLLEGKKLVRFHYEGIFLEVLERLGKMPLPPYIKEELQDGERYQTVYSRVTGSAAAPTAGLHFTTDLLEQIKASGVNLAYVTLHVGLGTFRPVSAEDISDHEMHSEFCMMSQETADLLNRTHENGKRIICVGTTSCRTIESLADEQGHFQEKSAWTNIFIYPGYRFKAMDALITNFHLPESTLIMLVSAFAGRENIMRAYQTAVDMKYRFFSFGDAMFLY